MPRDSIRDFVLSITTSNVVSRDKDVKTMFQEARNAPIADVVGILHQALAISFIPCIHVFLDPGKETQGVRHFLLSTLSRSSSRDRSVPVAVSYVLRLNFVRIWPPIPEA